MQLPPPVVGRSDVWVARHCVPQGCLPYDKAAVCLPACRRLCMCTQQWWFADRRRWGRWFWGRIFRSFDRSASAWCGSCLHCCFWLKRLLDSENVFACSCVSSSSPCSSASSTCLLTSLSRVVQFHSLLSLSMDMCSAMRTRTLREVAWHPDGGHEPAEQA